MSVFVIFDSLSSVLRQWKSVEIDYGHNVQVDSLFLLEPALFKSLNGSVKNKELRL